MRIIAGSRKSLPLKTIPGDKTRPTTDRIKETLFNIIGPDVAGKRFLDVFAGSGAIGLEALSRGAVQACFVEKSKAAVSVIKENIRFTKFEDRARIIQADARKCFAAGGCGEPYDILFMDPPYKQGLEKQVIDAVRGSGWITDRTLCIAETAIDDDISWAESDGIKLLRIKTYKTNRHIFFGITDGDF